jgi:predicted Rossmann fold nucleotide-binding protein DprA/Smf involved in DNA uptake
VNALAQIRKALVAAAGAAGAVLTSALTTKGSLTTADYALALGAAVIAGVATFLVPNAAATAAPIAQAKV